MKGIMKAPTDPAVEGGGGGGRHLRGRQIVACFVFLKMLWGGAKQQAKLHHCSEAARGSWLAVLLGVQSMDWGGGEGGLGAGSS